VGDDGRLVNGKTASGLVRLGAHADDDGTWLSIAFPGGPAVEATSSRAAV